MMKRNRASWFRLAAAVGLLSASVFATGVSCSATNKGSAGGTGGGGGSETSNTGGSDPGNFLNGDGGPKSDAPDDSACAATHQKAEQLPLDIYIMLDQSGSMSDTVSGGTSKWTAVTQAFTNFVAQPGLDGISIGIQYFPLSGSSACPPSCSSDADCGANGPCFFGQCIACVGGSDSCTVSDYAKPDVPIQPLPGVGPALIQSINKHGPTGGTPTAAALSGAISQASSWATAHPDHAVVAVLATDGEPTSCTPTDINAIAAIAGQGVNNTPKILTFVIGVGSDLANLNAIAAGGGTGQALIVDLNQNVAQQFLDALNKIRGAALGCTYAIPKPAMGTLDYSLVNVQYTPGGGGPSITIPKVDGKSSCPGTGDAWFYDNAAAPTQILLCDSTCKTVSADAKGQIDILLGCQTVLK